MTGPFPIIGIGASAGGLAALKQFFAHVPQDSGLAYVVVVHLSPDHKSHLAELLQPHVKMPVEQVMDTVPLKSNRVYVIPPNANLNTIDTHLRLSKLEEQRQRRAPIDHFFRTLASTHDADAIGVILTGTGNDGTLGLREIKERGGMTVVQDPNEAEYDGMPQSALSTGIVDLILPVREIPDAVLRFVRTRPKLPVSATGEEINNSAQQLLQRIFAQLRTRTGRDFSRYKPSTILRRIQRRMQLCHIEEVSEYLDRLQKEPKEVTILADDLLITVTSFFRDPEVFQTLQNSVVPRLFHEKSEDEEIRIWSVGCATGEEAYSLAILLCEEASRRENSPKLQVFASDLHDHSLKKAREGIYPGDIESDVSPERLKRFFVKESGGYRICKEVREIVVFTPHNLLGDPPFSRLDLISCRNLMIYLQREVQRDIGNLFHYALRANGFLLVGNAETVDATNLFRVENKKCRLYQKCQVRSPESTLPVFPTMRKQISADQRIPPGDPLASNAMHQIMVERYALPSALVDPDDRLVHLSENGGRYMKLPGGEPTTNIAKIVRDELKIDLQSMLRASRAHGESRRSKPILVQLDGETCPVVLHVRPSQESQKTGFVLVIFDEYPTKDPMDGSEAGTEAGETLVAGEAGPSREQELEAELVLTRQRLQTLVEEYDASQEEMRVSGEEMQSTNEELRSTME